MHRPILNTTYRRSQGEYRSEVGRSQRTLWYFLSTRRERRWEGFGSNDIISYQCGSGRRISLHYGCYYVENNSSNESFHTIIQQLMHKIPNIRSVRIMLGNSYKDYTLGYLLD